MTTMTHNVAYRTRVQYLPNQKFIERIPVYIFLANTSHRQIECIAISNVSFSRLVCFSFLRKIIGILILIVKQRSRKARRTRMRRSTRGAH